MPKAKREVAAGVGAGTCVKALKASYPEPSYAFFEQVANGTGWAAKRWADAVAFGIWPSRGMLIHGFEIKVSRQDWKKELDDPKKAEEIQAYCDHWWIVTPRGLLDRHELPPTWGLYEVSEKGKGAFTVPAPKLDPKPVTRQFMAAILRRHSEAFRKLVQRECHEAREEGAKSGSVTLAARMEDFESEVARLKKAIQDFQDKSGVRIDDWNADNIADAVRTVMNMGHMLNLRAQLESQLQGYERAAERLREDLAKLATVKVPEGAAT